ncbi:hypothetical protein BIY29_17820 [Brenneria alni]|uniref:Glycosyltransferase 2-like domain-containing protein n=1 Tax=Brenneria alni TaxID=71656 RepID=A0A421DJG4_9GAMM|nr:glycosyltransferase [Brenneria alni]RLM18709.1 hypothetical protein BIY29_17820 [Brenneria alni]
MLTHNALKYIDISIRSVRKFTQDIEYEIVVLDNDSDDKTKKYLEKCYKNGDIDKLILLNRNSLFAEGNNIAARHADCRSTHYLLLNSDIEVKSPYWLSHLLDIHEYGITSYGFVPDPDRVDGYCFLIDSELYKRYQLDQGHQWWWAVTKLQTLILNAGFSVKGYYEHEKYLYHFGGRSGDAFKNAKGMNVSKEEVYSWFNNKKPIAIDRLLNGELPSRQIKRKSNILKFLKKLIT